MNSSYKLIHLMSLENDVVREVSKNLQAKEIEKSIFPCNYS